MTNEIIQVSLYKQGEIVLSELQKDLGRSTKQRDVKSFGIKVSFWARHCDRCCHEAGHNVLRAKLKSQFHKTWEIVGTWGAKHEWSTGKKGESMKRVIASNDGWLWSEKKINSVSVQLQRLINTHTFLSQGKPSRRNLLNFKWKRSY